MPGLGLISHGRVFGPTLMLSLTWLFSRLLASPPPPFSLTPRLDLPIGDLVTWTLCGALVVVYAWSLAAYLIVTARERARLERLEAATRGRITQATARTTGLAA